MAENLGKVEGVPKQRRCQLLTILGVSFLEWLRTSFSIHIDCNRLLWARVSSHDGRHWEEPCRKFEGAGKVYVNLKLFGDNLFKVVYDESPAERF